MEFRQLRYFIMLSEEMHFSRAAQRYHIGQSALSQQLRALEREVGVQLMDRSTHHVRLTPYGKVFLEEAKKITRRLDGIIDRVRSVRFINSVRVGVYDSYESVQLILRSFEERNADLLVEQVNGGTGRQIELLRDDELDIGVGQLFKIPPEISSSVFRRDPMGVLVANDHHFAKISSVSLRMLAGENLIRMSGDQSADLMYLIHGMFHAAGFRPKWYPAAVSNVFSATTLIAHGGCVGCFPSSVARMSPDVSWRPISDPEAVYTWCVFWRKGADDPRVDSFVECARELATKHGWDADEG